MLEHISWSPYGVCSWTSASLPASRMIQIALKMIHIRIHTFKLKCKFLRTRRIHIANNRRLWFRQIDSERHHRLRLRSRRWISLNLNHPTQLPTSFLSHTRTRIRSVYSPSDLEASGNDSGDEQTNQSRTVSGPLDNRHSVGISTGTSNTIGKSSALTTSFCPGP